VINLRSDITHPRLLVAKGVLFLALGLLATAGLALASVAALPPGPGPVLGLHIIAVWAFCRAYYFAFYVLDRYIDHSQPGPERYAGLLRAAVRAWEIARSGGSSAADRRP
jgi:hypothetical protein